MSIAPYHVRRATVDDLPNLMALWSSMRLPADDLERRLTEFQLAESEHGELLGAIGMDIIERHGRIHSEAFNDFSVAEDARAHIWERFQSLAMNHGLARLWTSEAAPFWKRNGFHPADAEVLKRLPARWNAGPAEWLTLRLRDEDALRASLEMDFERLRDEERQKNNRVLGNAKVLNYFGIALVVLVVAGIVILCFALLKYLPKLRH